LLGTSNIGANDNFFEIGGHSLKASALAAKLTAQFGLPVSLRNVFDAPTIAELAAFVVLAGREHYVVVAP
jgi:acyl carrier protein